MRPVLLAAAIVLALVTISCANCDQISCAIDTDCGKGGACNASGFCVKAPTGEGEGEGAGPGEGEGAGPGEGEGEGAGPGEGEGVGPGEGEGIGPGEGEGEGEGAPTTCANDGQCAAPQPRCNPVTSHCVECLANADCGGATPACDIATHTCGACAIDADCPTNQFCQPGGAGCFPIPTDMILYLPLNGDANDQSAFGQVVDASTVDFGAPDRKNQAARAADMHGAGNPALITTTNLSQMVNSFTIAIWVEATNGNFFNNFTRIIGEDGFFEIYSPTGTTVSAGQVDVNTPQGTQATTATGIDSNWHFIVARVTDIGGGSAQIDLIVDTQLKDSKTTTTAFNQNGACRFTIGPVGSQSPCTGTDLQDTDQAMPALVDDVRVYPRAINDAEIRALFHENGF